MFKRVALNLKFTYWGKFSEAAKKARPPDASPGRTDTMKCLTPRYRASKDTSGDMPLSPLPAHTLLHLC